MEIIESKRYIIYLHKDGHILRDRSGGRECPVKFNKDNELMYFNTIARGTEEITKKYLEYLVEKELLDL